MFVCLHIYRIPLDSLTISSFFTKQANLPQLLIPNMPLHKFVTITKGLSPDKLHADSQLVALWVIRTDFLSTTTINSTIFTYLEKKKLKKKNKHTHTGENIKEISPFEMAPRYRHDLYKLLGFAPTCLIVSHDIPKNSWPVPHLNILRPIHYQTFHYQVP